SGAAVATARGPPGGSPLGRAGCSPGAPAWNPTRGAGGVALGTATAGGAVTGVGVAGATGVGEGGEGAVVGGAVGGGERRCAAAASTRATSFCRSSGDSSAPKDADLSSASRAASSCPRARQASASLRYG